MKLALGTLSKNKIIYLENSLKEFNLDYALNCFKVNSEISDYPKSEQETIQGAKNRAYNAYNIDKSVDYGIGLEGGLDFIDNDAYYICIACFYDGKKYNLGISSKLKIPVVESIIFKNKNIELVDYLEKYNFLSVNNKYLASIIISRETMFNEALTNLFLDTF